MSAVPGADKSTPRGATVLVREGQGFALAHPVYELVDAKGKRTRFDAVRIMVGAAPGNDFILDDQTVSSAHFEIIATTLGVRIKDLESTNGTRVNGVRIKEAVLEDGQTVHAGTVALTFKLGRDTVKEPVSERTELHGAVGQSPSMRAVFSRIERAGKTDATVLVTGETGTGKEVTAWAIYEASKRKGKPFVVVDCGAIAHNLIESELFGHEKGAFTGAVQRRIGAFERADGGTIFLDEIGELELDLQPKLLRVLERREITRVGGEKTIPVDVRIIAATNRDLRAMVARGAFREDLYYRLAVVALELPPLRERREDLPLLIEKFLADIGATSAELPPGAMDRFVEHPWPGNCRELKNAVERAVVLGETRFLSSTGKTDEGKPVLPAEVATEDQPPHFHIALERPYKDQKADVVAAFEEAYVRALMLAHHGNVSAAARQAGIDRMSLHKILMRYGLDARELASS
jgi:two-component system response regulator GlrR